MFDVCRKNTQAHYLSRVRVSVRVRATALPCDTPKFLKIQFHFKKNGKKSNLLVLHLLNLLPQFSLFPLLPAPTQSAAAWGAFSIASGSYPSSAKPCQGAPFQPE